MEQAIITEDTTRKTPDFSNHVQKRFDVLCKPGWIEGILSVHQEEEESEEQILNDSNEVSLDYELTDYH